MEKLENYCCVMADNDTIRTDCVFIGPREICDVVAEQFNQRAGSNSTYYVRSLLWYATVLWQGDTEFENYSEVEKCEIGLDYWVDTFYDDFLALQTWLVINNWTNGIMYAGTYEFARKICKRLCDKNPDQNYHICPISYTTCNLDTFVDELSNSDLNPPIE